MFSRGLRRLSSDSSGKSYYDIVISGGGMIGSTMALALGKNPMFKDYKIALVEASPKKPFEITDSSQYSNRVSAINPFSKDLFEKLGVWKRFRRFCLVNDMKVWGAYSDDRINYRDDSAPDRNVAYIVENDEIVNAVVQELNNLSNVDIVYKTQICGIEFNANECTAVLSDGKTLQYQLLIGADGPNSFVRKFMNVDYLSYSYNQIAVVATLNIEEQENTTAWQRFLPTGPIALLPLNSCLSSLVWSTTNEQAKSLLSSAEQNFIDSVNSAFNSRPYKDNAATALNNVIGSIVGRPPPSANSPFISGVVTSSRAAFPLGFGHASEYIKPHVALIGDSAHKVHPLAGQGVNLGFRDVHNLTSSLSHGVSCGRPLGDIVDLENYQQSSQRANVPIMLAIDLINRVYTSEIGFVRALGTLGIRMTESLAPIKNVMRQVASS